MQRLCSSCVLPVAIVVALMTGSPLTSLRKKLTVISSSAIGDDEIELVSSILPQKFAVNFKTIGSDALVYTVCSEIRRTISLYSSLKGETIVVILPDHAPLISCKNEQNGSVVFAQKNERNFYRYGDLNAERNLDRIGTKQDLLDYLDRITTAKDSFADVSLQNKANIKRKRSYNQLFVVVCTILALLVVLALLLIQCLRHRKRRWKSLRRRKEAEYNVDPTQKTDEIQEKLDPTQEMDESMLAAEPSAETSVESAQTRSPVSFDKNREGSSLFVKAEPARSLTEVLENPVSPNEFIRYLQMLANLAIEWSDNPIKCSVTSDDLPGSLYSTMSLRAPETPDTFEELLHDIKHKIISKITHWQHPRFHAFYPSGPCYSNTLGNFVRHTIATFGQCDDKSLLLEELVFIVVNWVGRALGLPESFLFQGDPRCSRGGGTVVRSTSNAIFYFIMTSKRRKVMQLMELHKKPQSAFEGLMREMGPKLVVYINKDAHPYAKKACSMAMVKCHAIQAKISNNWGLTGSEIEDQIQQDLKQELIPLLVYCTMGTTPSAIVDHIESIGPVAKKYDLWMHCDGSYGGNCWIEPKYRPSSNALDFATSINVSLHKFLVHGNGDMIWTKEYVPFKETFQTCQEAVKFWHEGRAVMCDWGIRKPRCVSALIIWLAMRLNGLQGLRYYVNNAVETCAYFAQLIRAHPCCKIVSHNYALVCFQYTEPGFSADQVNKYTRLLCNFMNESQRIFLTSAEVDNNDLISVSINYDRTSEANVDSSWLVMKSLIEEFRKRRDDPYLLLSTAPSNIDKRENSNFGRYMYDSVANTPEHSPTKNQFQSSSSGHSTYRDSARDNA